MSRFINPFPQFFDDSGDVLTGGSIAFYDSGTTELKAIYADAAFAIPLQNPVPLDCAGGIPSLYLDGAYRVVLLDKNGVQQKERDPVTSNRAGEVQFDAWLITQIYGKDDIVVRNGTYYISIVDDNQGNDPQTGEESWLAIAFITIWNRFNTYGSNEICNFNGDLYRSIQAGNINNSTDVSPLFWTSLTATLESEVDALTVLVQDQQNEIDDLKSFGVVVTNGISASGQVGTDEKLSFYRTEGADFARYFGDADESWLPPLFTGAGVSEQFSPQKAGLYKVSFNLSVSSSRDNDTAFTGNNGYVTVRKNGLQQSLGDYEVNFQNIVETPSYVSGEAFVEFNGTTDYVEIVIDRGGLSGQPDFLNVEGGFSLARLASL